MASSENGNENYSWMTQEQQMALQMFKEISQISNDQVCIEILTNSDWDVDRAIDNFMHSSSGNTHEAPVRQVSRESGVTSGSGMNNTRTTNVPTTNNPNNRPNESFNSILAPLRWLFQTRPTSLNRDADTRKFITEFNGEYGSQHPVFADGSYQSAVAQAFRQSKFLLIYLHSPMHEDTPKFCHQVMCTQTFTDYSNENFICWAGRIWDAEGYDLSSQLRVTSYPFLALLVCQSDKLVQVADRVQGTNFTISIMNLNA